MPGQSDPLEDYVDELCRDSEKVPDTFSWLREDLIRGIPHFISPAWTQDRSQFDPEQWAECWERIGLRSVTLLTGHHDGYLLYPSKLARQQPDRDYFGEQVAACRKRGIRVMAYYSLSLDSLVGSEHPEWRIRDLEGRLWVPQFDGAFFHYHWLCLNSPYRDFAVAQLEEVVEGYDVEGVWIDILYLPPHPSDLSRDTCFCDHCHRQYSEWHRGEHLVDAAGTPKHDLFRAETYREFLRRVKAMLGSKDRPVALTFNGAGRRRQPFYKLCDEPADFLSGEAHDPVSLGITARSHRNDGRPFELLSCSEVSWSHNQLKPDTLIKLESLSTLMAGGTYTMGITHAPDGRLSEANVERLARWGQWVREREGLLRGARPVYEAALLAGEGGPGKCAEWALLLRKAHVQYNVLMDVPAAEALERYGLVVVPWRRGITQVEVRTLREYVRRGGRVLLEYPREQLRGGDAQLEAFVGARLLREARAYAFYLAPEGDVLAADIPPGEPVLIEHDVAAVVALRGAVAVGRVVQQFRDKARDSDVQKVPNYPARPEEAERWPGLIHNRIGAGCVLTTALPLTARNTNAHRCPWPEALAQNCARFLLGEQMVSLGAWNQVEVFVCEQDATGERGARRVLHFVNHSYGPGDHMHGRGESELVRELPVRLRPDLRAGADTAVLEPEGVEIALTEDGFVLPALGVHAAVTIKRCS